MSIDRQVQRVNIRNWTIDDVPAMQQTRVHFSAVHLDGSIYAIGANFDASSTEDVDLSVERYASNSFSSNSILGWRWIFFPKSTATTLPKISGPMRHNWIYSVKRHDRFTPSHSLVELSSFIRAACRIMILSTANGTRKLKFRGSFMAVCAISTFGGRS